MMRVTSSNLDSIINNIEVGSSQRDTSPVEDITTSGTPLFMNNGWNDSNERTMMRLGENSAAYKWMHEKTYSIFNTINNVLNMFVIILGTSLSAESVVKDNPSANTGLEIFKSIGIYTVTILTVVINFLKLEQRSSEHKEYSVKFLELYQEIQSKLSMYRRDRPDAQEFTTKVLKKYDNYVLTGPDISDFVVNKYKKAHKDSIIDKIEPIEPVIEMLPTSLTPEEPITNIENKLEGITPNVSLRDINLCVQRHGDITDQNVKEMDTEVIRKLNNYYIDKQSKYQYERFINQN